MAKRTFHCPTCEDRGFVFVEGTEDQPDGPEVLDCPTCSPVLNSRSSRVVKSPMTITDERTIPCFLLCEGVAYGWAHILLTGEYRWRKQRH